MSIQKQGVNAFFARWRWFFLIVIVAVGLGSLNATSDGVPAPLDPNSAEIDGTKAAATLATEMGAKFEQKATAPKDKGNMVVLGESLNTKESASVRDWVHSGGTAVVTSTDSSLADGVKAGDPLGRPPERVSGGCSSDIATGVNDLRLVPSFSDRALEATNGDVGCFPLSKGESGNANYFMVVHKIGLGRVIVVASPGIFTNGEIGRGDNSVLVAHLMDAQPGANVVFARTENLGGGSNSLADLIPYQARNAVWQLLIAGLVLLMWRWRRLANPVIEADPVETSASALVIATGNMSESAGRHQRAANTLRDDLRRSLSERMGLPYDTPNDVIADIAAARTRIPVHVVRAALANSAVNDGKSLVELAQTIEAVNQEVAHGR